MTGRLRSVLRGIDPWLVGAAAALVAVGLGNLHGLGIAQPRRYGGLALRQGLWAALAAVAGGVALESARRGRHRALAWAHAVGVVGVVLTLAGLAPSLRGVRRWLALGPLAAQPAELVKLGVVAALARYFGDTPIGTGSLARSLVGVVGGVLLPAALVVAQPDLGTGVLVLLAGAATLAFTPGARRHLAVLAAVLVPALWLGRSLLRPYQRARVAAFLDPEGHRSGSWQIEQAMDALAAGRLGGAEGWLGDHLLPGAHTDFALVAWGSAHGLVGTLAILALLALLLGRVFAVATRADDRFDLALVAGAGALVALEALTNVAMSLGLLPVVGVPLPLVSYGGSNLVATAIALGAVLGVRARVVTAPPPPASPGPERLYRGAPDRSSDGPPGPSPQ